MRKIAAAAVLAAFACLPVSNAVADGPCNNESGDISVAGLVGVDHPGANGYYVVCVAGRPTGVWIDDNSGPTCIVLIVNGQSFGC